MSSPHSSIRPNAHLFLRLPTKLLKLIEIKPNTIIDVGKLGCFHSNSLLGRPYHYTYELLEKHEGEAYSRLRIVPPRELNEEIVAEDTSLVESRDESRGNVEEQLELLNSVGLKNNRLTIDDATRQALSQAEIEELKKSTAGKEIIEKILANHAGLEEKTAFSKAKYLVRKKQKYLKRFTALPMDLGNLIQFVLEKEPTRILEMREETLGLVSAWSNVHLTSYDQPDISASGNRIGGGRWLVVDETGGLLVAAMAERMGILYQSHDETTDETIGSSTANGKPRPDGVEGDTTDIELPDAPETSGESESILEATSARSKPQGRPVHRDFPPMSPTNSITLLHPAVQPNVSLLKYFGYDANNPDLDHPLHTRIKSLSWLQLLHPDEDPTYREPERANDAEISSWKSGKRSTYWKKRRRWERCRSIVDEAREGGFEGLVIASNMDPATIFPHAVPLVRGGGHVVVYSPTPEPLVSLVDLYSKERRMAYISHLAKGETPPAEDFPVDPRILLAPTMQTSRVREWQVLPGRTHPLMTSKGGADGYVFTARKVIPVEGGVEARGNFGSKRRKVEVAGEVTASVTV
nr:trna (adenine(58)-n(1))-methyltransferase non-catalytic subunit trm6 [Quercus suber]